MLDQVSFEGEAKLRLSFSMYDILTVTLSFVHLLANILKSEVLSSRVNVIEVRPRQVYQQLHCFQLERLVWSPLKYVCVYNGCLDGG